MKKTFVGKSYSITTGDEFKITVGKSSLVMKSDGTIVLTGNMITTQAESTNTIIGKDVQINPPGGGKSGAAQEAPVSEPVPPAEGSEVVEIGPDGLPILGSDSDEYQPNITVRDQDGNIIPEDQRLPLVAGPPRGRSANAERLREKRQNEWHQDLDKADIQKVIDMRDLSADVYSHDSKEYQDILGFQMTRLTSLGSVRIYLILKMINQVSMRPFIGMKRKGDMLLQYEVLNQSI